MGMTPSRGRKVSGVKGGTAILCGSSGGVGCRGRSKGFKLTGQNITRLSDIRIEMLDGLDSGNS